MARVERSDVKIAVNKLIAITYDRQRFGIECFLDEEDVSYRVTRDERGHLIVLQTGTTTYVRMYWSGDLTISGDKESRDYTIALLKKIVRVKESQSLGERLCDYLLEC